MEYNFIDIEKKWRKNWAEKKTFRAIDNDVKPKYYVLDMFPYPSGAGLHVGHPLGYIASDIYARYKRLLGYNVLHPMGYDSFGLPAEQYAIQTGQHPDKTTKENILRYREQLDKIGFSFDWDREVRTSDSSYYKWTQWIFKQLYNSWYDKTQDKARAIDDLISIFETAGNAAVIAHSATTDIFAAADWKNFTEEKKQQTLMNYRLTFLADSWVNWCPALGTVLANDEIKDGVSERGGHPVEQKLMRQWSMRITAYAERLINDLDTVDWTDSIKDQQRNWIGKSVGAVVGFKVLSPALSKGKGEGKGEGSAGYLTGNPMTARLHLQRAQDMRKEPTKAEAALWKELKSKKLGIKIRQQHLIDNFIVDFVCLSKRLVIDVDGEIHETQKDQDAVRTHTLLEKGYTVIRFSNEEVLDNIEEVLRRIKSELLSRIDFEADVLPSGKERGWEIEVFTTRPDTIFGVSFMVLAPEHSLVDEITTEEYKDAVAAYKKQAGLRTERDRQADVKNVTGQFTGAYAIHPFTGEKVEVWIADYVLAGYGTGAVMAVPCGDQRDWDFAKHFGIEIKNIFKDINISEAAYIEKDAVITNSDFLNDLPAKDAIKKAISEIEKRGIGKGQTNYRLRDAVFSRQRYWGEPFPVYYQNGIPYVLEDNELPVTLPEVDKYLPTENGEPPLARAKKNAWNIFKGERMEYNTMPGWAGSSWYFLRYMDPHNEKEFVSRSKADYWGQVDLYIGGSEHATGHLLYSRFWAKFLFDMGYISFNEPFKKMINQGMILGVSAYIYIVQPQKHIALPDTLSEPELEKLKKKIEAKYPGSSKAGGKVLLIPESTFENIRTNGNDADVDAWFEKQFGKYGPDISVTYGPGNVLKRSIDISLVEGDYLKDLNKLKSWHRQFEFAELLYAGDYKCTREIEKMSKSKFNVQTPDDLVEKYGADTLRLYEMFLGPLEQAKPWDTQGISGVHNFLRRFWRLFHNEKNEFSVSDSEPEKASLKTLHKTIKKIQEDLDRFSFNTGVSNFMIATNEFTDQKCNNRFMLREMLILLSSYAPHICEELWEKLGEKESISYAPFPKFNPEFLVESSFEYPVSFNGKMRFKLDLPLALGIPEIEKEVMAQEMTAKYLEGKSPKKVIIVHGKIVNLVV